MGQRIKISTKFDCTCTGITGHCRSSDVVTWTKQRNQQRNYETLTQIIGLYTQPQNLSKPQFDSNAKKWFFEFETEFEGIFRTGTDELGILKNTCRGTPMITGLTEPDPPGSTLEPEENIWFEVC